RSTSDGYALKTQVEKEMVSLDSAALWPSLLDDLRAGHDRQEIAWRFHLGLAASVCEMATALAHANGVGTVALSGGVFQNKILFELVINQLESGGFSVLSHRNVPSNDGGLALGQAVIGTARSITTG
ncbi:MAG: carbamoyltransferase HypF, partial [Candidatus Thiodiazotropha sp. (ex Lucinoma borealis)]|nr:carbamoyltransferase HypF [Candidatus Thiodiazotropha sp. (ex Lucinoma borealis)]